MQAPTRRLTSSTSNQQYRTARLAAALQLLALALTTSAAHADCQFKNDTSVAIILYNPPTTLEVPAGTAEDTILYDGPVVAPPTPYALVSCASSTFRYGLNNTIGSQPDSGKTVFPTGIAGIGYRFAYNSGSNFLPAYGGISTFDPNQGTNYEFRIGVSLQFVKTADTFTGGMLISGSNIANQQYDNLITQYFVLGNPVTFISTGCDVKTPSVTVTLPTVGTSTFNSAGSTVGDTGFNIDLSCSSGAVLYITLDTTTPNTGHSGTILNAGSASGVGVQILDGSGTTAVTFGTVKEAGATHDGDLSVAYTARYIQTGTSVSAGSVNATATFTLSYQ